MELHSTMDLSKSMRHENGRAVLRQAFRRLEHEVPGQGSLVSFAASAIRIRGGLGFPVGFLLILGGIFSILPFLGLWMLPLGLLLIAYDITHIAEARRPVHALGNP